MKSTCLLWDFDGTLAYRDGMWTQSLSKVLDENGYKDYDRELISKTMNPIYPWARYNQAHSEYFGDLTWWGYIRECVVGKALTAIGITNKDENEKLAQYFKKEYLRLSAWYLFDDTKRNLERSKNKGYANIILSNHTPELCMIADYLDITKYFKHIVTSAQVGYEKPNSKLYETINNFKVYDEYYMIGDNYNADILGSKNFGLKAIMVRKSNEANYANYSEGLDGIWEYID